LPVSIKSLYETKSGSYVVFRNIAAVSLFLGLSVPTTPIRLFDSYTTPLCKAPFREKRPKIGVARV
ncbi:MAG: hypothetical protein ACLR7P_05595, partial [Faecalibacterium sp.]